MSFAQALCKPLGRVVAPPETQALQEAREAPVPAPEVMEH